MRIDGPGAPPVVPPDESAALKALARNWDGAREGDDKIGRKDLEKIAGDSPPDYATPELVAAAKFLLDTPAALDALDAAAKGGTADGKMSIDDLTARLQGVPLTDADRSALSQLTSNWNGLRGGDQKVGRGDLEKLIGPEPPAGTTPEMIDAARYLLDHPELSKYQLDVAQKGGKPDDRISVEDLAQLLTREYAGGGALAPEMADVLLAAGSEDDGSVNDAELERGLERSGFEVDGGKEALAPVISAFDGDRNAGLGTFELREAIKSGALVIDGQVIRIQGLTPLKPGHDNTAPDAANDARIDRPIDQLDATELKALTVPTDSTEPGAPGKPVTIGDDSVTAATAAYATNANGQHSPLIVATGASGTRYAVDPDKQPHLFASLTGVDPATGSALGKTDGAAALHAVPVGGYTLPDGSRGLAAADPLGERALTELVTRYRDAGEKATPAQQKFIRALEATQYISQDTDLGDKFTDPLTTGDARAIFDADKVDKALTETFADPSIQADYATLIRDFTPDIAGTVERMYGNATSTDFSDYVNFLQASGQDDAASAQVADALLGLQELDPDKASAAAAQLNVNLMAARIDSTDIGDLTAEETAQATSDVLTQLGYAKRGIGDITGALALKGDDLAAVKNGIGNTLDSLVGNTKVGQAIGDAIRKVQAAGGNILNASAVASQLSGSTLGQSIGTVRTLVNDLGTAGVWGSVTNSIAAAGAIYRVVNNGDKLSTDPWERLTLANELIGVIGGSSSYVKLAGAGGKLAGFGDLADKLGLAVPLPDAAKALKGQFDKSSTQAITDLKALDLSDATDRGKIESTLVNAGVKGDTKAMAADIGSSYDSGVQDVTTERDQRGIIRLFADYTQSGPGTRENTLAQALVGVDLSKTDDVAAALKTTPLVTTDNEAKAIADDISGRATSGTAATTLTDVDDILKTHNTSLVFGAVDTDIATSGLPDDVAAARKLSASNVIDSLVNGSIGSGATSIGVNTKRAIGLGINSLGTIASTTGGFIGLATGIKGLVDGVNSGDPKAIASSSLGIAGAAVGVTNAVLLGLRGASLATKFLGPVSLVLDVVSIFVSIFAGGPTESEAFADGFDPYKDDGLLLDDGKRAAESWYLDHIDIEESTVAS